MDNKNDAFDIIQNVFAVVWENKKYKLDEKHLKAYLFNATRNACLNYVKHKLVVKKYEDEVSNRLKYLEIHRYKNGEQSLIEKEGLEKIHNAINSLSEKNREIIELSRLDGLKNDEIAKQLNLPIRTVETRLFRALKNLRKILANKEIQVLFSLLLKKVRYE